MQIGDEDTKFGILTTIQTLEHLTEVNHIFLQPPTDNKYSAIRNALIKRIAHSQEDKTRILLQEADIEDRKSSQFIRHLEDPDVLKALVRTIWLNRIPRAILAMVVSTSVTKMAETADRILQTFKPEVNSVCTIDILVREDAEANRRPLPASGSNNYNP